MNIPENFPTELRGKIFEFVGHPTAHLINLLIMRKVKYGIDTHSFTQWYFFD